MLVETSTSRKTKSDLLRRIANLIDQRPYLFLPIWIVAYFAALWRVAHRPLWYDELFTYNVSMAPDWRHFIGDILHVDLNPPLNYFFVRASIVLFGDSPFSARLPSMLGFLMASLIFFYLISRRLGGALGLAGLGIFWSFLLTAYAVEARPYGLLLAFFSMAALCWLNATERKVWTKWHAGLAAAITAMLLTHCFSPVYAAAIIVGELVRTIRARPLDKRVWTALLPPLALLPLYIPLVKNAQSFVQTRAYDATLSTFPMFYVRILMPIVPAIAVTLLASAHRESRGVTWRDLVAPHEAAFGIAAFAAPTLIIGYCMRSGVSFWDRYGIGAVLGGSWILTALLALVAKKNTIRAAVAAALILTTFCLTKAGTGRLLEEYEGASASYQGVRPDLPFVVACGITFLEMDHREPQGFTNRLYYLMDKASALGYVHATIFEGYPTLQKWFPVRAKTAQYREFVNHNREFLVLARMDCPMEWLLLKLKDEGARIRLLQKTKTGYHDHELYEVTLPE